MLTVILEAGSNQFDVSPLLIVLPVAAIALVLVVFLLRYRRKGD